nr:angiotensin-converting enzyme-like [Onthophagus taurus]
MCYDYNVANWEYNLDINNSTKEDVYLTKEFTRRHANVLTKLADAALEDDEYEELTDIINEMTAIYSKATVCPYKRKICDLKLSGLPLEPDIEEIFAKSKDLKELSYYWAQYRRQTGFKIRPMFKRYVELKNKIAKSDNYSDFGEYWRSEFEIPHLDVIVDNLWNEIKPLYDELHFYVLNKLKKFYGDKIDVSDGLIPAHLTGNIHAQTWINILPKILPFPDSPLIDLTTSLKNQNYTVLNMFKTANEFFTSLNLEDMSMAFGPKGVIEKSSKTKMICHPMAWEFCRNDDFRISVCAQVNQHDFFLIHHELGHIQYYLQYKNQPVTFKDAPNPAFHEAIGDVIVLSVMTPQHLMKIGLLNEDYKITNETTINNLISLAVNYVTMLPYALILDKWRWDVFSGTISEDKWNDAWWNYRKSFQKIKPPVGRNTKDFDPGSKYHVAADTQFISYFLATIMEFQIYKGICIKAGQYHPDVPFTAPLHECDFYNSTKAGELLNQFQHILVIKVHIREVKFCATIS